MSIKEYEFFNGVVLNKLIRKGKPLNIDIFPSSSQNTFILDGKVGIYIKYSKKLTSPWRFTFLREHQEEFKIMSQLCSSSFLILVCNKDGIVCIDNKTLKNILDDNHAEVEWISASRLARESYSVKGSDGKLKFKINISDFPKNISDCL